MHRNRTAFTLLESLIVLVIATMILGLGVFSTNGYNPNKLQERFFWQSFQRHWQFAERVAIENNTEVTVTFFKQHVQFIYHDQQTLPIQINYPNGLTGSKRKETVLIKPNGYVSPKTIRWDYRNYERVVKQTFQLGWGIYRVHYDE